MTELLSDQDLIRTNWPRFVHKWLFSYIAKKRAEKVRSDYEKIGGGSPIFRDTEAIASLLREKLSCPVIPFHRYLKATHKSSLKKIEECQEPILRVIPMFPQFSFATTGSIARFFSEHLSRKKLATLRWVASYPTHLAFINSYYRRICEFLTAHNIEEKEIAILFSCHGVPLSFIEEGDIYEDECNRSFQALSQRLPQAISKLSYQSKFGSEKWLEPSTEEMCQTFATWSEGRRSALIVPLSFTSDHIETLFEIEELYLPLLRKQGFFAGRCAALNLAPDWIFALQEIAKIESLVSNENLIRKNFLAF